MLYKYHDYMVHSSTSSRVHRLAIPPWILILLLMALLINGVNGDIHKNTDSFTEFIETLPSTPSVAEVPQIDSNVCNTDSFTEFIETLPSIPSVAEVGVIIVKSITIRIVCGTFWFLAERIYTCTSNSRDLPG